MKVYKPNGTNPLLIIIQGGTLVIIISGYSKELGMFRQLFNDLMSVWVMRWGIYGFSAQVIIILVDWLFSSPIVDTGINVFYYMFMAAFIGSGVKEHLRESREEQNKKAT